MPAASAPPTCSQSGPGCQGSKAGPASAGTSASPAAPAIDPKMRALVKPILSCQFEKHKFIPCWALNHFATSNDAYFETDAANRALIDMLTGNDEKLAQISAHRRPRDAAKVLDKTRVEHLLTTVGSSKIPDNVRRAALAWLSYANLDKLGLTDRLDELAENPDAKVRKSVPAMVPIDHPTDAEIDLVGKLLGDNNGEVVGAAAQALSAFPANPKVCGLLEKAVERADATTTNVVTAVGEANCKDVQKAVIDYVAKKTRNPAKITAATGADWALAVRDACDRVGKKAKKKGFTAAVRMTEARDPDPHARVNAMSTLVRCDRKGSRAAMRVLARLARDKNKDVSQAAKDKLKSLRSKK